MTEDLTLGGEHIVQYPDGVLKSCTVENYHLVTNITPIHTINKKKNKKTMK